MVTGGWKEKWRRDGERGVQNEGYGNRGKIDKGMEETIEIGRVDKVME